MSAFRVQGLRITFSVTVKPRAPRDRLLVNHSGRLRLEVRAAPVEGEANRAVIRFLAKGLRIPQGSVEIAMGTKGRDKVIRIVGQPPDLVTDRMMQLAEKK